MTYVTCKKCSKANPELRKYGYCNTCIELLLDSIHEKEATPITSGNDYKLREINTKCDTCSNEVKNVIFHLGKYYCNSCWDKDTTKGREDTDVDGLAEQIESIYIEVFNLIIKDSWKRGDRTTKDRVKSILSKVGVSPLVPSRYTMEYIKEYANNKKEYLRINHGGYHINTSTFMEGIEMFLEDHDLLADE